MTPFFQPIQCMCVDPSSSLQMKINGKIVKSLKAFGDPSHQNDLFFQYLSRFKVSCL